LSALDAAVSARFTVDTLAPLDAAET